MKNKVKKEDSVVLIDESLNKYIIDVNGKTDKYKGIGVFDPSTLIGTNYGEQIKIGSKQFWILYPSLQDKLHCIKRRAQIILPPCTKPKNTPRFNRRSRSLKNISFFSFVVSIGIKCPETIYIVVTILIIPIQKLKKISKADWIIISILEI